MDFCFSIRCILKSFPDVTAESLMTGFIKTIEMGVNLAANVKTQHLLIKLCYNCSLKGNALKALLALTYCSCNVCLYIFHLFIDHTQAIPSLLIFNI